MNRQSLEAAISQLDLLMANDSATEDEFQKWFELNPVVFEVLSYQKVLTHPRLTEAGTDKYILDFLAQRVDGVALHLIVVIDTTAPSKLKSLWTGVLAVWAGSKDQVAPGN